MKEPGGPLSRSSCEAYVGVGIAIILAVLPMTYWLRAILFIILAYICSDFIWRSPFSFKWHKGVKIGLIGLAIIGIVWVGRKNVKKAYDEEEAPPPGHYMTFYGTLDPNLSITGLNPTKISGLTGGRITVNGDLLGKYASKYNLVATCFFWDGREDFKDATGILKSKPFDIAPGQIDMVIPWNQEFIEMIIKGATNINYAVLLVPKSLDLDSVATLRQAINKGARLLELGATTQRTIQVTQQK